MLTIGLKGLDKAAREIQKWADQKAADMRKAMSVALKTEGYRLMGVAKMGMKKALWGSSQSRNTETRRVINATSESVPIRLSPVRACSEV